MTIHDLAGEALRHFTTAVAGEGEHARTIVTLADGTPDWVRNLAMEAHGEMLPDDWRYAKIRDALEWLADDGNDPDDSGEFADSAVDTYTADRLRWLGSHLDRAGYIDGAREDGLLSSEGDQTIAHQIGVGQYAEASEIHSLVVGVLRERAEA